MSFSTIPKKTTVLVVGGGPAGSYAASVLARRGIEVIVLEAAKFPRYHIGESLLASTNYFLEYIGAREKVLAHGFIRKPGGAFKLRKDFPAAYTNFVDHATGNHALNVNRAEYDNILFEHAASQGAKVFDEHKVNSLNFSEKDPNRPISAQWESKINGTSGVIEFDYIIDAAGRQGLLSTKYHKDRKMTQSLKNSAIWAYYKNAKHYGEGTERYDNTGWCWYIPINDDTISVGFVMHEEFVKEKKKGVPLEEFYLDQFKYLSEIPPLRGDAKMVPNKEGKGSPVYMASDYSYASEDVGKLNYRIAGDSAAFIDPFFSSGVHLAFVGALSAAISIISLIDGDADENTAAEFHNAELKTAYTRFFIIVMAGYKQMRGGINVNVLNDVNEKNFDRAFSLIRPVIQGTGDIGVNNSATGDTQLSEDEIRATMDFVFRLFNHQDEEKGEGIHSSIKDLDGDARSRITTLSGQIPQLTRHDGEPSKFRESLRGWNTCEM
ncbi:hypothetical protein BDQ17DRAFT_1401222 [Cyathus striatus]|nr:hypothetical protein BDQ17DRAFT_1401222 [Cyathus striatus]